jgi:hypothetical protein
VRRDRIRARPRKFYADLLERLNSISHAEPAPAFALEHSWHAIFVSALGSMCCLHCFWRVGILCTALQQDCHF